MKGQKIYIYDSTLRDGGQSENVTYTVEDKLNITKALDDFGVDYIEAGNPGSNPKDLEFFRRAKALGLKQAKLVAFGSTRRRDVKPEDDKNILALLDADTDDVCIFGKCWDMHVTEILQTTPEENLRMIADTIEFFTGKGKRVHFDGEHFCDGYKHNPEYALSAMEAAVNAGAFTLTVCDTNGGCFPDEIYNITRVVREKFHVPIGIHCHNDTDCAVANSIMAVKAGASIVQGTFIGFGERCGNACLASVIPGLQLKGGYDCVPCENMAGLTATARYIADCSNLNLEINLPYAGKSAFAHKGGMHVDGVNKNPASFEHIPPEAVGNKRNVLLSEISGRTAILRKLNKIVPDLTKDSPETAELAGLLKKLEYEGYQYEAAIASLELMVLKKLGRFVPLFELVDYHVLGLKQNVINNSVATVKVNVENKDFITADEGDGPVNALDKAFRRAIINFFPEIEDVKLVDYKVRVLDTNRGTATKVRVLIESADGADIWTTVGVSTDIINASLSALVDSIEYKLLKDKSKGFSK